MTERDDKTAVPDPIDPSRDMPPNYDPFGMASALVRDKELARTCAPDVVQRLATELLKHKDSGDTIKELKQGILELQSMLCARDGVPMPSERPLVDKLRSREKEMKLVLMAVAEYFDTKEGFKAWAQKCRDAAGFGEEPKQTS